MFAHLRQLHLTFHLLYSKSRTRKARLAGDYDIFFIDQLSTAIPFLRNIAGKRVVFYGHFPDKLLSEGPFMENAPRNKTFSFKALYRLPMDLLEDYTTRKSDELWAVVLQVVTEQTLTGETDILLVNSKFTARVFRKYMPNLHKTSRVVYPGINIEAYDEPLPAPLTSAKPDSFRECRSLIGDVFSYVVFSSSLFAT